MKKITLVLTVLFSFAFANTFAQSLAVNVGDIANSTTAAPIYTTSDRIVRSAKLIANLPDADILSYTFSITAGATTWGPVDVTGPLFTTDIIAHLRETRGPNVNVRFEHIQVKQDGIMHLMPTISLKYDQ